MTFNMPPHEKIINRESHSEIAGKTTEAEPKPPVTPLSPPTPTPREEAAVKGERGRASSFTSTSTNLTYLPYWGQDAECSMKNKSVPPAVKPTQSHTKNRTEDVTKKWWFQTFPQWKPLCNPHARVGRAGKGQAKRRRRHVCTYLQGAKIEIFHFGRNYFQTPGWKTLHLSRALKARGNKLGGLRWAVAPPVGSGAVPWQPKLFHSLNAILLLF